MPECTGRKMAPCPARRALESPPRKQRAAFKVKSAGKVAGAAGARDRRGPTHPKLTSAKELPNGTAGWWRKRACQSSRQSYYSSPATNGSSAAGCGTKGTRPRLHRNTQRSRPSQPTTKLTKHAKSR